MFKGVRYYKRLILARKGCREHQIIASRNTYQVKGPRNPALHQATEISIISNVQFLQSQDAINGLC